MRYTGLVDPSGSVYMDWRVLQPEPPYPQDYVIGPDGIVRFWADHFDPQAVIATIDRLLETGTAEPRPAGPARPALVVRPGPVGREFTLFAAAAGRVEVVDALGRVRESLTLDRARPLDWRPDLPAGSYLLRLVGVDGAVPVVIVR